MKSILLGALCLFYHGAFIEAGSTHTGNANSKTRILGGSTVDIKDHPYQISMRMYNGIQYKHFCGGSIIDNLHIVTAAHCVQDQLHAMSYMKIFTGTGRSDSGGIAHSIRSIKVHPGYAGESTIYHNDIAVITLNAPIAFNSVTQPINLPTKNIQHGTAATITGWGLTSDGGQIPIYLQEASMYLLESTQCRPYLPHNYNLQNTQVCIFTRPGYGICSGDSGGPLVANNELVGVASYVVKCGSGKPEVFTNVYPFVGFIKETIISSGNQYLIQPFNPLGSQHPVQSFNQFGFQQFGQPLNPFGQQPFGYGK